MVGSSFKKGAPTPSPVPAPNYTMVDITDWDIWDDYYEIPYAVKVVCTGYLWENNAQEHQAEYVVWSPSNTSIWNMDAKFYSSGSATWVHANVYVKWSSQESWSFWGAMRSYSPYVTTTVYDHFLSLMSFSIFDLLAPE
jgi:hypothetical protein